MRKRLRRAGLLAVLALVPMLAACSSADRGSEPDADADADADSDADAEEGQAWIPYWPPALAEPYVDEPFLQEDNHTTNEVEPGIGALVDVVRPPGAYDALDDPTQVTPRGWVQHDGAGNTPRIHEIDAGHPDLIAAARSQDELALASAGHVYRVAPDGTLTPFSAPAGTTITGLADGAEQIYLLTDQGLGLLRAGAVPEWQAGPVATAAVEACGYLQLAGLDYVSGHPLPGPAGGVGDSLWTLDADAGLTAAPVRALVGTLGLPQEINLVVVGDAGLQAVALDGSGPQIAASFVEVPEFAADRVPLGQPQVAVRASDGGFIVGTAGGAYRIMDRGIGPEWRVYNQERWLPSEDVRGIVTGFERDAPIHFATAAGLATVTARRITLEQKFEAFVERVVLRHDRRGAVADSRLTSKGDLSTSIPWDSDNDGSWTSYWLLAECFRYKVTGDPEAKAHVDESLEAMLRLRDLTGTDHFVARSVIHKASCNLDDCDDPDDGEWFTSPDGEWWVKGDTSNDEVVAHAFMMGPLYDLCADEEQRDRIREHITGIVGGIVDNGFQLLDIDGEVTTYGQYGPAYVNDSIEGQYGDGGTRSLGILGELTLAYYMTGDEKFREAKQYLIEEHHYDENCIREADYAGRRGSGDGDELGMEGWWLLMRYEDDPHLRSRLLAGWDHTHEHLVLQQAAWWDLVDAAFGGTDPDLNNTMRWLRLAPVDMIRWNQHNSHRLDLMPSPEYYSYDGRMRSDGRIIPYDERRCDRWNTDQFRVDGGMGGMIEMDGAEALASYWLGRYYGFIVPQE